MMNGNVRYLLSDVNFECYEVQMLDNKDVKKARQKFIKDYNFLQNTFRIWNFDPLGIMCWMLFGSCGSLHGTKL